MNVLLSPQKFAITVLPMKILKNKTTWTIPDSTACTYNSWKYGFEGTANAYVRQSTNKELTERFISQKVTYFAGLNDTCNQGLISPDCICEDSTLDKSCSASLQGDCRLQRAFHYLNHVMKVSGGKAPHRIVTLPGVGHSAAKVFNSPEAIAAMFKWLPVYSADLIAGDF